MIFSAKLSYNGSFGRLLSITSFSSYDFDYQGDLDHTELTGAANFALWQREKVDLGGFNQEFRIISNSNQKLSYVAGLFFQKNTKDQKLGSDFDDKNGVIPADFPGFTPVNDIESTTYAIYANTTYSLTEKLELNGGLRLDIDKKTQRTGTIDTGLGVENVTDFNKLQPKIGLSYKIKKGNILFVNYGEGYRSGGFNPVTGNPSSRFLPTYKQENSQNIELGYKSSWWSNRFILNASIFRTKFENQQVYVVDLTSNFALGSFNLEETANSGFEIEMKLRPAKNLDLGVGLGVTGSEIKKASIADRFPSKKRTIDEIFNGTASTGGDWVGNEAPFVAKNNFIGSVLYTLPFSEESNITIYGDVVMTGASFWHPDNFDKRDAFTTVNFKASYNYKEAQLSVFGNNITNQEFNGEYFAAEFSGAVNDLRFPGVPRVLGAEVSYKF